MLCLWTSLRIKKWPLRQGNNKTICINIGKVKTKLPNIISDRFESFAAAAASHILGFKNIHLHGGESTLGAIDDKLRMLYLN